MKHLRGEKCSWYDILLYRNALGNTELQARQSKPSSRTKRQSSYITTFYKEF
jgi:hypothetical protein